MTKMMWLFKNGAESIEHTSFPYAFRTMWNTVKKETENNKNSFQDVIKKMVIISPLKDIHGDNRRYNYTAACELATTLDVLKDGGINKKAFRDN